MWKSELGSGDVKVIVYEDVDVDDAVVVLSIHRFVGAPHGSLNVLRDIEYLKRRKRRGATYGCIDKCIVRLKAPRLSSEESWLAIHLANQLPYSPDSLAYVSLLVAKVGTETEIYFVIQFLIPNQSSSISNASP